jgi:hypothetical protein
MLKPVLPKKPSKALVHPFIQQLSHCTLWTAFLPREQPLHAKGVWLSTLGLFHQKNYVFVENSFAMSSFFLFNNTEMLNLSSNWLKAFQEKTNAIKLLHGKAKN